MRQRFYFAISIFFWLVMAVGFSDNWLTDRGQPSNSDWRFLIHAFFAFGWFSILVIQIGLINTRNRHMHMKVGIAGMITFAGFLLTTLPFYVERLLADGKLEPLAAMVFGQLFIATILIASAFLKRKSDSNLHKTNMMIGSLLLLQPAADRAAGHLFGEVGIEWLAMYLILFGLFIWFHKAVKWQIVSAFLVWVSGLAYVLSGFLVTSS